MRTLIVSLIIIALIAGSVLAVGANATNQTTTGPVTVTGPSTVAISSNFSYSINVQQIFKNYSITMIISGYNLTGASPISPTYRTDIRAGPTVFNVTAPSVETTMRLLFQVTGYMTNGQTFVYNTTSKVTVKQYTTLKATINNTSDFNLTAINVTFNVNGKYVGSELVNVSSHATKNVSYDWVSGDLPTGVYTVSIILNNSIANLQNGNSYTFQIQSGNPYAIYIYIGIVAFFAIIIAVLFIASYYARKRRPKWKK